MAPYVISLEGPPGAGKGFLLKHMATTGLGADISCSVRLQPEAISHILDYNTDAPRWALFTELFFLFQHATAAMDSCTDVCFVEGSPLSDNACYYKQLVAHLMHPLERALYEEWFDILEPLWHVDMSILLSADTHAFLDRVIDNGKTEESHLGLEQIQQIWEAYLHGLDADITWVLPCSARFEDSVVQLQVLHHALANLACARKLPP